MFNFIINFIRRLFFGVSAGIAGLCFLLIKLGGIGVHIYTMYFAYKISGFFACIITFFCPVLSQFYWVITAWNGTGQIFNKFSIIVFAYIILAIILWVFVIIFGAVAVASSKNIDDL